MQDANVACNLEQRAVHGSPNATHATRAQRSAHIHYSHDTCAHLLLPVCQWSDPLLHSRYTPQLQPRVDWLIPAPYVDNGEPHNLSVIEEKWSAEHKLAFGRHTPGMKATREVDTMQGDASHQYSNIRNVPIFFGGRTSTRIGPGHAQMGYYARWSLMRSWAQHDKWAAQSNLGVPGSGGGRGFEHVLIVDSDRGKPRKFRSVLCAMTHKLMNGILPCFSLVRNCRP